MIKSDSRAERDDVGPRQGEYVARLRDLQRREWWTWGTSVFVMLLLTAAIASLAFPAILGEMRAGVKSGVLQSVSGLLVLILLFGCYLTYEKILINRLRIDLAEKQIHSTLWRNLALVDPLTGLYNRRFAERTLKAEMARAQRKGYALTLVMFDLNGFKKINDRFGHAAGDLVLKEFAGRLCKAVREADVAARLGGDEFMLILTECDSSQVHTVLRRLQTIEIEVMGQRVPVEFAAGWKELEHGESPEDLMAEADKALYRDKHSTREVPVLQAK
ncbi:MAG: GGDEF domain-containing protein [Candidatus Acidiferrales bacterium]